MGLYFQFFGQFAVAQDFNKAVPGNQSGIDQGLHIYFCQLLFLRQFFQGRDIYPLVFFPVFAKILDSDGVIIRRSGPPTLEAARRAIPRVPLRRTAFRVSAAF